MALTTFGAKLRKWRDENELTRRELSEMIYFSENAIRGWETGGTPPSYDAMIAVADCMGVSLDWLTGRSDVWKSSEQLLHEIYNKPL